MNNAIRLLIASGSAVIATTTILFSPAAPAAPKAKAQTPLFKSGLETFELKDAKGKTPVFRILDDTPQERALAGAAIAALNMSGQVQPKLPAEGHIDVKLETLKLKPVSDEPDSLEVAVRLNGHEVDLPKHVSRAEFLSGKTIQLNFPSEERNVALFNTQSSGRLSMRLDPKSNVIHIPEARARLNYSTPLGDEGSEEIRFSGQGIRKL